MKTLLKKTYLVHGMHCASCKIVLEKTLLQLTGVKTASVNFGTEVLTIAFDTNITNEQEIKRSIENVGNYSISPYSYELKKESKILEYKQLKRKITLLGIICLPFTVLMIGMMVPFINELLMEYSFLSLLVQFAGATLAIYLGKDIYMGAWSSIKNRKANMDVLIAIGTFTAYFYSTLVSFVPKFQGMHVDSYFEAAVFIIFFIMLGRFLEMKSKGQTSSAVEELLKLSAKDAIKLEKDIQTKIAIDLLKIGDIVLVKTGEKVPLDGEIIEGQAYIDESMITGEPIAVLKGPGDVVTGATINTNGLLKVRVTKIGEETVLSQIIKLVEEAQATQAPIQQLADKVSSVFVPFVIVLAFGTFALWLWLGTSFNIENPFQNALYATVSVLIIACPCALGLATPTAIVVGTGEAAKQGILFKDAKALEIANKIKFMVFDKTGTLTKGQPKVHKFIKTGTEKDLEALILSTEMNSTHPLAQAIVKHFSTDVSALIKVDTYNETAGHGIEASIGQKTVIIGSAKFALADKQKESLMPFNYIIDELYEKGLSVVFCSVNGKLEAILGIGDEVKDSAREVVKELKTMNVQSIMLTGDNEHSANFIGNSVGLNEVIAEVSPKEKSQKVRELQLRNTTSLVGFVGDGINDAPALAQANVGIAMGTGTDVALQSGSVVLVGGNIVKVPQILKISKKTLSVIRQNLIWAFGYNLICIPVAAGLLYPQFGLLLSPAVAGAAMALSSVSVVLNSLRLKTLIK